MFGIGDTELLLIALFAFLLLGPDKLPAIGRTLGKGLRQFRQAQDSVTKVVQTTVIDPMKDAAAEVEKAGTEASADLAAARTGGETFAERKARLARERAEAEASEPVAVPEDGAAGTSEEPRREAEVFTLNATDRKPEKERPKTSVASLYGLDTTVETQGKEDGVAEA